MTSDNLFDPVTFDDLILSLHCNCEKIDRETAKAELREILNERLEDMYGLFFRNVDEIIRLAKVGRGGYET